MLPIGLQYTDVFVRNNGVIILANIFMSDNIAMYLHMFGRLRSDLMMTFLWLVRPKHSSKVILI